MRTSSGFAPKSGKRLVDRCLDKFAEALSPDTFVAALETQLTFDSDDTEIESLGSYDEWLQRRFPHVATHPLGERHRRLWEWFADLTPGTRPRPQVEVWPRGGAKSSTAELACTYIGIKGSRRFVLYVCETQDQADKHVQAIATLFERVGVDRALGKYGHSKGWRRDQLRTANGFNVAALGLDVASRGIKLDEFRPDLIIFDDIDNGEDSPKTVAKKLRLLKYSILPAGSTDCAILFLQNLIHENSIVSQLADGRADFLYTRNVPAPEPAVIGLQIEKVLDPEIQKEIFRIVSGTPTWAGQSIATCEQQINDWGAGAFKREAQHEVKGADGFFFDHTAFRYVDKLPSGIRLRLCRAWDLAATQDGGDYTVGVLMGIDASGNIYILDVIRHRFESKKVRELILRTAARDARGEVWSADEFEYGVLSAPGVFLFSFAEQIKGRVRIHLPQDPGQAGKDQAAQLRDKLSGYEVTVQPVTGRKAVRARGYADKVNAGSVYLIRSAWNHPYTEEHRTFREDEDHEHDDQVDPSSDAYNELAPKENTFQVPQMPPSANNPIASYRPR